MENKKITSILGVIVVVSLLAFFVFISKPGKQTPKPGATQTGKTRAVKLELAALLSNFPKNF